ncbi:response regulator transcription factor [Stenotrophomonas sp. HMWF023]|uniref:response regulator transcription factor n=1 Tax=Stenotrophomonas sp. HMWF023 TaxID=2056859 RepID=UPI000D39E1A7|nr:response regulator transcription factor [Stenotrophomonas sp. HMWF023]PTS80397.1 DNA-binding response regulator [Stenotrophomonas sp. HMWF023]
MAAAPTPITIALLDDHPIVRSGLNFQLQQEPGMQVVASCGSSAELLAFLARSSVDVVITDFALGSGDIDGLNLIRALHVRYPNTRIIVVSAHYNQATIGLALKTGANGFIGKVHEPRELAVAVLTVMRGKTYLDPDMARSLEEYRLSGSSDSAEGTSGDLLSDAKLSPKEAEVVRCVLEGLTTTEISAKFNRQANTISTQKRSAYRKLGIDTDGELHLIRHLLKL